MCAEQDIIETLSVALAICTAPQPVGHEWQGAETPDKEKAKAMIRVCDAEFIRIFELTGMDKILQARQPLVDIVCSDGDMVTNIRKSINILSEIVDEGG